MKSVSRSEVNEDLSSFLEGFVSGQKKSGKFYIAIQDKNLAGEISSKLDYKCKSNDVTLELFRGIRIHFTKYIAKKGTLRNIWPQKT